MKVTVHGVIKKRSLNVQPKDMFLRVDPKIVIKAPKKN